jgi:hypothetical protein
MDPQTFGLMALDGRISASSLSSNSIKPEGLAVTSAQLNTSLA